MSGSLSPKDFFQAEAHKVTERKFIGYAEQYLDRCKTESKSDNINYIIDIRVFSKLVELDSKLGTLAVEQLFWCLIYTTRWDIIKV